MEKDEKQKEVKEVEKSQETLKKEETKKEEPKKEMSKKEEPKKEEEKPNVENVEKKVEPAKKEEKKPNTEKKVEPAKKAPTKKENKKLEKKTRVRKNVWGVVVTVILVAALAIGIVCTILLQDTPSKSIDAMLMALKTGDFIKAEEFVNYQEMVQSSELADGENAESQKLFFDRLEWNINEIKKDVNTATAQVEITNKDYKTILSNYMQKVLKIAFSGQSMSEQEMQNSLIEELKNQEVQTATNMVTMQLEKKDGKWRVISNEDLMFGLMPGLKEAMDSLNNMSIEE